MKRTGAVIGIVSGGLAVAVAHLVAAFTDEAASPLTAVGSATIDLAPPWLKEFAIATLGSNDKPALLLGIGVILTVVAAAVGVASLRHRSVAYVALCGLGLLGAVAAMTRPASGPIAPIPSLAGVVAGLLTLRPLFNSTKPTEPDNPLDFDRRRFLFTAGGFGALAVASGGGSFFATARTQRATASRETIAIPAAADVAKRAPAGADLKIDGLSSFYTSNETFYRVDTALIVPKIDAADWTLKIHGMVDREIELSFDDLVARPLIERDITLACVSNEVGDRYIGNARWVGAPLRPLLEEAGVHADADQLVSRSADGWTAGSPTSVVMDGRDAMLAVTMNGEPLPLKHGFPVRMVVPGLYGFVSATKWIVELELTTFDAFDAYWVPRGWARRAPIKTQSRIDTPRGGQEVAAGTVPIAGIAWAQHHGIERVEVGINGDWREAELAAEDTVDTWRQWVYRWDATPGDHTIAVRATDKRGRTQTSEREPPIPDGATGWHTISVTVVESRSG